jgi:hypothetical protein
VPLELPAFLDALTSLNCPSRQVLEMLCSRVEQFITQRGRAVASLTSHQRRNKSNLLHVMLADPSLNESIVNNGNSPSTPPPINAAANQRRRQSTPPPINAAANQRRRQSTPPVTRFVRHSAGGRASHVRRCGPSNQVASR